MHCVSYNVSCIAVTTEQCDLYSCSVVSHETCSVHIVMYTINELNGGGALKTELSGVAILILFYCTLKIIERWDGRTEIW